MKNDFSKSSASFKRRNPHLFGVTPEMIWESYQKEKSIYKVGAQFGVCAETIRHILNDAGHSTSYSFWTEPQITALRALYTGTEGIDLKAFSEALGKSEAAVACKADELGLTSRRCLTPKRLAARQKREEIAKAKAAITPEQLHTIISERRKAAIVKFGHPRGMLGKHHSEETKQAISKFNSGKKIPREQTIRRMKTCLAKYGRLAPDYAQGRSWKAAWVEVGGKRFYARSKWEANYGRYLEWLKVHTSEVKDWWHEPDTFWFEGLKRGCVSYLPDFKVEFWDGRIEYHEVKGWMDARSATKIKRMAKYHPEVTLVVIDSTRYKILSKQCKRLVPQWE